MKKKTRQPPGPPPEVFVEDEIDPYYHDYHITGAWGGFTPTGDFSLTLEDTYTQPFSQPTPQEHTLVRVHRCRLVMSPTALKNLADWLNEKAKQLTSLPHPKTLASGSASDNKGYR